VVSTAETRALVYRADFVQGEAVVSSGVVREYDADEGWGVLDGADVPGGCWVHFSAIVEPGFRHLSPGELVSFRAEAADQDGFTFRAVQVWKGQGPGKVVR